MEKEFKFVGFWERVWITVIDFIIYLIYTIIIGSFGYYVFKIEDKTDLDYIYELILLIIIPIIILFFLWKYKGGSLGKIVRKTQIVDVKTGKHPTDKQLLSRLFGNFMSIISFFLSFIHVGLDSRKQSWHDKIAHTAVVKNAYISFIRKENKILSKKRDKVLMRIEIGIFSLLFLGFIVFMFFMFYDEPLQPGTKKWLYKHNFVEDQPENNGFYHLVGFDCLNGKNPFQKGFDWVNNQNKKATEKYEEVTIVNDLNWSEEEKAEYKRNNPEKQNYEDFERIDLSIISDNFIVSDQDDVLNYYVNKKNLIDSLKASFNFINERYSKITSFSYFDNTLIPHYEVNVPIFMAILNIKRLNLAWIGKEYKIGNKQKAIEEFRNEMKLSRYLLKNTQSLMGKLVANILFEIDLHLLSHLIDESNNDYIKLILPSKLTPSEKNWEKVSISNFNQSISSYLIFHNPDFIKAETNGKISAFLFKLRVKRRFKLNKLINETYNSSNFMYHLSRLNAKDFIAQKDNYPEFEISLWDRIFDPAGSIFAVSAVPIYHSYMAKFHDIDGYINMLKLKVMIKNNHLKSNEILYFIKAQSDSLFNPYTEEAFKWDSEQSVLYFDISYDDDSNLKEVKIKL